MTETLEREPREIETLETTQDDIDSLLQSQTDPSEAVPERPAKPVDTPSEDAKVKAVERAEEPVTPLILDKTIQGTLAIRVSLYWIACVIYFSVVLFFSQVMTHSELRLRKI